MTNNLHSGILIYAQITKDGFIHPVFWELVNKAKKLAKKLDNADVNAVILLQKNLINSYKEAFSKSGINKVFYIEDDKFCDYSTEYFSKSIIEIVKNTNPEILLIGATNQGRDLAPRISAELSTGLTADCTDLDINENKKLAATRPTFGGQLMATILCKNYPQMATVRPNVFSVDLTDIEPTNVEYISYQSDLDNIKKHVDIIEFKKEAKELFSDLTSAEVIVAGGKGLKTKENFKLIEDFAKKIGASVGSSRGAVEIGIAPISTQVGQTGKTVKPKVYIACAISGAIQHTIGMENSAHIIAINNDSSAPIFDIADVGIIGDVFEVLPKLLEEI